MPSFKLSRRVASGLFIASMLVLPGASLPALAEDAAASNVWPSIKKDLFPNVEMADGNGMIDLDVPVRAEDAAIVPITVKFPASFAQTVKKFSLVVDNNPVPLAATFTYGPAAGAGDRMLSTRIRVNQYTDIRVVAETNDGKFYMVSKFVKASGGCSAPAAANYEAAMKVIGKMQVKKFASKSGDSLAQEAQVMIKHLNITGMQMEPSGYIRPARYVNKLEVKSGSDVILTMDGGITISEDPNLRFTHGGKAGDTIEVKAEDTEGAQWAGQSVATQS